MDEEGDSNNKMQTIITAIIVAVIIVAIIVFSLYFSGRSDKATDIESSDVNTENIGGEIFEGIEESNEVVDKAIPDTNPFGVEGTNPFDNYKNPFE